MPVHGDSVIVGRSLHIVMVVRAGAWWRVVSAGRVRADAVAVARRRSGGSRPNTGPIASDRATAVA